MADQIRELYEELVGGAPIADSVQFYINTGRTVLEQAAEAGYVKPLESLNVKFIVDTCAYITSIFRPHTKLVMTNSGKVAHYAPGNMGVDIVLATLHECVESARKGIVEWDRKLFND